MYKTQGRRDRDRKPQHVDGTPDTIEKVVRINHVSKVVKGGRRFGFSTIVVVGDGTSKVGVSIGKAKEVPESITKGRSGATKGMKKIKVVNGTIPHTVMGRCGASRVLLRPAVPGTGIIAGAPVRAIMEAVGIKDIISKTIGSSNAVNVVKATMDGLYRLRLPEEVAELRGKAVSELFIAKKSLRSKAAVEQAERMESQDAADPQARPGGDQRRRDRGGPSRGPSAGQSSDKHASSPATANRPRSSPRSSPSRPRDTRAYSNAPDRQSDRYPRPESGGPRAAKSPSDPSSGQAS